MESRMGKEGREGMNGRSGGRGEDERRRWIREREREAERVR